MSGRPEAPRPGPGRPKLEADEKRQSLTIRLPPDLIAWLEPYGRGRSALVERAIRMLKQAKES